MATIKAAKDYQIVTGDVLVIPYAPVIVSADGATREVLADTQPGTEIKASLVSLKFQRITDVITAAFQAAQSQWIITFSSSETNKLLKDPADLTSDVKYPVVHLEVQIGAEGSIKTVFFKNLAVAKGVIP